MDWENVRQARANIIAGACLGIGFRFAGTADHRAFEVCAQLYKSSPEFANPSAPSSIVMGVLQVILVHIDKFVALRKRTRCHAHNDLHLRPKSATLDSCIGVLAIAISMVRYTSDLSHSIDLYLSREC